MTTTKGNSIMPCGFSLFKLPYVYKYSEILQSQNNFKRNQINAIDSGLKTNVNQTRLKGWTDQVEVFASNPIWKIKILPVVQANMQFFFFFLVS